MGIGNSKRSCCQFEDGDNILQNGRISGDNNPRSDGDGKVQINRYYCETVGNVNEETIKKYIGEQYERDRMEGEPEK